MECPGGARPGAGKSPAGPLRRCPGRAIHVVADSARAGSELKTLLPRVTWTTQLRKDAASYGLPPARTGKRGGPDQGNRLPALDRLAATTAFARSP
jgi:hypothetical protein